MSPDDYTDLPLLGWNPSAGASPPDIRDSTHCGTGKAGQNEAETDHLVPHVVLVDDHMWNCGPEFGGVRPFPLSRRIAKVRDVASKLATKRTRKHIDQYREQVESALINQMVRSGIPADHHQREVVGFWRAVGLEMARHGPQLRPGGGAA